MNVRYLIHRSDDSDQKYGVPELKKFPMPDADHVRSAIKFFNYITPKYEEELARAILKRMKEYGLTFDDFDVGKNNRFLKYMPEKAFGDKEMKNKYLIHHGIAGQKWGQTNGPPYPLDYDAHSSAEKKKNPKSKLDNYGNGKTDEKKRINDAFGFDLSKYTFTKKASDGSMIKLNAQKRFEFFGASVNNMINTMGKEKTMEYLQKEWGFSKEDAASVVNNLNKVYSGKSASSESSSKGKGSKGGSGGGKGSGGSSSEEESETTELPSAKEIRTSLEPDYNEFKDEYANLSEEEIQRLSDELGITNADEYAEYVLKEMLKESYGYSEEDAEETVKRFMEGDEADTSDIDLDDIFGFDLSKYDFNSNREGTGVIKKNAKTDFDTFASTVQWLLNEYGPDQVLDHLMYEWDFSENDAKSVIKNLSKAVGSSEEMSHSSTILIGNSFVATLIHHGIDGQKWGIQNGPPYPLDPSDYSKSEKKALKQDLKWIKKNEKKVYNKAYKESKRDLNEYAGLLSQKYGLNKNGKLSAAYVNAFNRGMAELMNEKVTNITSPSGRAVKFVAKRGRLGVYTALADRGYNMSQVKNGVWTSGRIAYRKTGVAKVDVNRGF